MTKNKIIFGILSVLLGLVLVNMVNAQVSKYPQITDQSCDVAHPCADGLVCYSFPGIGVRCAQPDPCSYFCPGTVCNLATSYPGQINCGGGTCEGENCQTGGTGVSYNVVTGKVEVIKKNNAGEPVEITIHQAPGHEGTLETPTVSAKSSNELFIEQSKLLMETSAGKKVINILPEDAISISATPNKDSVKEVELKEELQQSIYSIKGTRQAKLLFIIPVSMQIETKVNAESGNVISIQKPWWSFLAR